MKNILDQHRKDPIKENVLPFLSSIYEDMWILEEDVIGTIAHVIMLKEQKIILDKEASNILEVLLDILNSIKDRKFEIDPNFEDIHPYIESIVIENIGIGVGGKIHSARSRNDQVALDIRLKLRKELINSIFSLIELNSSILSLSEKCTNYFIPLYTHLQRGQLGVFSHYLLNYSYQIGRIIKRLFINIDEINKNPLGACAIGGSSFNINRKRTTELLGLNDEIFNSIDAVSSRDFAIASIMNITLIADCFTRISEDLIIWASKEFNFVEISDGYASVSSAMPQKKNPDTLELIKGKMSRIYGALNQILFMSKGTPTGYVRDFQETKVPLKCVFDTIIPSIQIMTGIFDTLILKPESMKKAVEKSMILSLDLSEYLVKHSDLSFREGHGLVGSLVKKYNDKKLIFDENNIKSETKRLFNKNVEVTQDDLNNLMNPEFALKQRISSGSPNLDEITKSIIELKEKNIQNQKKIIEINSYISKSEENLINLAQKIVKY